MDALHSMNSDLLAAICTLLLIASKIGVTSRGEPIEGAMYIVYVGGTYLFWAVMRGLADAMTGKNYIRGRGKHKVYREETPARYWLLLICSIVLNAYLVGVIFDLIKYF